MKNIIPFSKENYPIGYSRSDAAKELVYFQRQREDLNKRMKSNLENSKRLETELKRGGRTES
jgi:hypothetical protein